MVFDRDGNYLNCWGIGAITDPHGINIVDDVVYITDRADHVAVKFTLDGKPLQIIGDRGVFSDTGCEKPGDLCPRAAGLFNYCTELSTSPSGDLYVSCGYVYAPNPGCRYDKSAKIAPARRYRRTYRHCLSIWILASIPTWVTSAPEFS